MNKLRKSRERNGGKKGRKKWELRKTKKRGENIFCKN